MTQKRFTGLMSAMLVVAFLFSVSLAIAKPNTLNRDEIPDEYKWDLSQIYPDWDAWQADFEKIQPYYRSAGRKIIRTGKLNICGEQVIGGRFGPESSSGRIPSG